MTDNSELILLLRQTRASMLGTPDEDVYVNCQEAAYVIEKLQMELAKLEVDRLYMETASKNDAHRIAELEAVLIPFASYYVNDCTNLDPDYCVICEADEEENNLTVGLFRTAYKALEDK